MVKKNKVFIVIALSLIVLATTIFQRVILESNNKTIDIVLDYVEMKDMAEQSDYDLGWWFSKFSNFGVKYVGLHEETIESLMNDGKNIEVIMGWEVLQSKAVRDTYLNNLEKDIEEYGIDEYDMLVTTESEDIYNFIYNGLKSRYHEELFQVLPAGEDYTILLKGNIKDMIYLQNQFADADGKGVAVKQKPYSSKLIKLGLGFNPEKIEVIKKSGLEVMPRPSNYIPWTTDQYIEALFKDFENYNMIPPVFIFTGDVILGYPDYNYMVAEYMQENDIKVGLIETAVQREHIEQTHIEELVRGLDYNAVRIFSVWPYIQERFKFYNYEGAEEIENTLYRAVTERNIRMIYFKPFKESKVAYVTDFEEYEKCLTDLKRELQPII